MEGRMFRFRARVASLFAVRLNRAKRFASLREKQKSRPDRPERL
jgi:hypothetical protein